MPYKAFSGERGRGGGGPGLVDTSIGKFRREARGHGRSVPVKCNFIHEMGMEKGEVQGKACRKRKHKVKALDVFSLFVLCVCIEKACFTSRMSTGTPRSQVRIVVA